jgi:hypothetical protein
MSKYVLETVLVFNALARYCAPSLPIQFARKLSVVIVCAEKI